MLKDTAAALPQKHVEAFRHMLYFGVTSPTICPRLPITDTREPQHGGLDSARERSAADARLPRPESQQQLVAALPTAKEV